jgi:hypothetical protein
MAWRLISAACLISALSIQNGYSQDAQAVNPTAAFQRVFGIRGTVERDVTDANLFALRKSQELRTRAPADVEAYKKYLEANPLVNFVKQNPDGALFHLMLWNQFALDITAIDHTTINVQPAEPTYAEQYGPHRAARAMAIVHLAMFEAVNAIYRKYESYSGIQGQILAAQGVPPDLNKNSASVRTAIAYAAYETLRALYRQKTGILFIDLVTAEGFIGDSENVREIGKIVGTEAAKAVLANRNYDGTTKFFGDGSRDGTQFNVAPNTPLYLACKDSPNSLCIEQYIYQNPSDPTHPFNVSNQTDFDHWQIDPQTMLPVALGADWPEVRPFVLPAPYVYPDSLKPPVFTDKKFTDAYLLGGYGGIRTNGYYNKYGVRKAGQSTSSIRDKEMTFRALLWGYDGTSLLCAPPRLYNMVATAIATTPGPTQIKKVEDMARFLALVNLSLADAGVVAWSGKYKFSYPRPVTYIKHHEPDKIIDGTKNSDWLPLGFANTNGKVPNGTPPFPANPSGHAVFGGAFFETMSRYYKFDKKSSKTKFRFVSDEFNGINRDEFGNVRKRRVAKYANFDDAEWENAESRVWMGVHWQFDADDGRTAGNAVGKAVIETVLKPLH